MHALGWALELPRKPLSKDAARDLSFILTDLRYAGLLAFAEERKPDAFHVVRHPDHAGRDRGWSDHFLDVDAQRGLAPGERWQAALARAVDQCEAVVFVISPAWRDSPWYLAEIHQVHQARSLGKPIFGVLVVPTPLNTLRVRSQC